MCDDHAELRRDDVKPLRRLLADHMHRRAAAGAVGIFWRNRHVDVRQMGRKVRRDWRVAYQRACVRPQGPSCPLQCSDRLAKPFLMSVWPVASQTRTPVGTGIMAAFQARAGSAAGPPPRRRDRPGRAGRSRSRSRSAHSPIGYPIQAAPEQSSPAQTQGARQAAPRDTPCATKTKADWKSRADAPSPRPAVGPTDSPRRCEPLPHPTIDGADPCQQFQGD